MRLRKAARSPARPAHTLISGLSGKHSKITLVVIMAAEAKAGVEKTVRDAAKESAEAEAKVAAAEAKRAEAEAKVAAAETKVAAAKAELAVADANVDRAQGQDHLLQARYLQDLALKALACMIVVFERYYASNP
jgi:hypothetical protein